MLVAFSESKNKLQYIIHKIHLYIYLYKTFYVLWLLGHTFSSCFDARSFFFSFFRASPMAHESSQDRGWTGATAAGLCHSHCNPWSEPCLQPTPQLTAMPDHLTHWARPGIEPAFSWILFGLNSSAAPQQELWC